MTETQDSAKRPPSSAREVAAYLTAVRAILDSVNAPRREWVRSFSQVLRDAKAGEPGTDLRAGRVGEDQLAYFQAAREKLANVPTPSATEGLNLALSVWLDKQIAACDSLIEIGRTGDLGRLRVTHGLFSEARQDMRRFSVEYQALIEAVRKQVQEMKAQGRGRRQSKLWPFKRPVRSA